MKTALAVEGGSLRCMFSSGVMDVFLEHGLTFDGTFGSSSGSLTLISYVAGQIGRTKRVNLNFAQDKDYIGAKTYFKNKSIFNFDYMFKEISDIYIPLNREAFEKSPCDFTATATSCRSGQTVYLNKHTCSHIYQGITAGSSLPLLSPIIEIDGEPCLDGGISNAIPFQKALDEGYDKVVVIGTREHGFLKPQTSPGLAKLYAKHYAKYPEFVRTLLNTPRMYEQQMAEIERLQHSGRIFVLRPEGPVTVSRMEQDTSKLLDLYEQGRFVAEKNFTALRKYLES